MSWLWVFSKQNVITFVATIHLRFIDDPHDVETSDGAGVFRGLALGVVEVGRNSDDGVGDGLAEVRLCRLLHLGQHHGRDLLRCERLLLPADHDLHVRLVVLLDQRERKQLLVVLHRLVRPQSSDETLCVKDGVLWVRRQLILGGVTDETLTLRRESDVRRRDTVSLVIGDDLDSSVLENSDTEKNNIT